MNWKWVLFSFRGRIRRSHYWYASFVLWGCEWIVLMASYALLLDYFSLYQAEAEDMAYAFLLPFLWPEIAIMAKRLHDHGYSGWFTPLLLIPGIGSFAAFYFGVWPAKRGANKYGPDPLGEPAGLEN